MSCCLKNYAKKAVVLTPQRPQGAITPLTPLTPLTSEHTKFKITQLSQVVYVRAEGPKASRSITP